MSRLERITLLAASLLCWTATSETQAAVAPATAPPVTLVQNVNEPGLNPYQHFLTFNQSTAYCYNFACTIEFPVVPTGKRLVITYASAQFALASGGTLASVALASSANENNQMLLPAPVIDGLGHFYLAGSPVTFFVEAGDRPVMILGGQYMLDNGNNGAQVSVTGYLVNL
jgi:hypothetical protein